MGQPFLKIRIISERNHCFGGRPEERIALNRAASGAAITSLKRLNISLLISSAPGALSILVFFIIFKISFFVKGEIWVTSVVSSILWEGDRE